MYRNSLLHLVTAGSIVASSALSPAPASAGYEDAETILNAGTLGGTRGLRIRQIGGAGTLFSKNSTFQYYPASSIKVLQHLYAMTLVESGTWNLASTNGWVCTSEDGNCSPEPNLSAGCSPQLEGMDDILTGMMVNSSNQRTNTVQERVAYSFFPYSPPFSSNMAGWGRAVITTFAHSALGMSDTGIYHKFNCGGFCGNDIPNTLTLVDIEKLYRAVATNTDILSTSNRIAMHDAMLNEAQSFVDDIIDEEALATGKDAYKDDFRDQLFKVWKGGEWNCSGRTYVSNAGLIQLPTYNGAQKRLYTWGVFAHDTETWAYLSPTPVNAVKELLRLPIRAALLTWGLGYLQVEAIQQGVADLGGLTVARARGEAGDLVRAAIVELSDAEALLSRDQRAFGVALEQIEAAHSKLEQVRRLDATAIPEEHLKRIVLIGHEVAIDALALASTAIHEDELGIKIGVAERAVRDGRRRSDARDDHGALEQYRNAVNAAQPLIEWQVRGHDHTDRSVGFTGKATAGRRSEVP